MPRPSKLRVAAVLVIMALSAAAAKPASAAPRADPWPRWQRHAPAATARIDHSAWDRFLRAYLVIGEDGINRIAFAAVAAPGREQLTGYVAALESIAISRHNRRQQLAFWLNLYNAVTLRTVLDHYPVASIRDIDISPGLFAVGPWGKALVTVEGVALSLDDIEHRILRPGWRTPLIHYGVSCAALGCPNLAATAYTGDRVMAMLTANARAFIGHPRGVGLTKEGLTLSKLYRWYAADFGASDGALIAHIVRYAEPRKARLISAAGVIAGYAYDWRLIDAGRAGGIADGRRGRP